MRVVLTAFAASSTGAAITMPFINVFFGIEGVRFAAVYQFSCWITGMFVFGQ